MNETLIAQRYARALSLAIPSDDDLNDMLNDLNTLDTLCRENLELHAFLCNLAIPRHERLVAFRKILDRSITQETVKRFAETLLKRGRITLLAEATERFAELVDQRLNLVTAYVTSATPLKPEQEERVREGLTEYSGRTVRLITDTDTGLIGGLVVRLDGVVLDGSLRSRLAQMKNTLLSEEN